MDIPSSYLSFRPPLLVGFPEGYEIIHFPESIRDASGHRRRHAKCTMDFDEVVGEIIEGCRSRVIFQLARNYELLKMPRVEPILREFEKRKQDEAWDSAKDRIVLTREFLDELFLQRLVNMKTHPRVGDLPIVKMFETGYKRTGDIQPARISAEAKAGNISQLYAKRLYLPEWRKEAIERIQGTEREESGTEFLTEGDARQR